VPGVVVEIRDGPAIGRWFTEQEDQFGGPKLAVLTHPFWIRHFSNPPY
jgi:hypothetical protein